MTSNPPTPPQLTEEAKKEIADAVAIVREDRFEKWFRSTHGGNPPKDPSKTPPPKPPADPKDPPPNEPPRVGLWGNYADS